MSKDNKVYTHPVGHLAKIKEAVSDYEDLEYAVCRERIIIDKTTNKPVGIPCGKIGTTYKGEEHTARAFQPGENVGILTGKRSNITVLDLDNKTISGFNSVELFKTLCSHFAKTDEKTEYFINKCPYSLTGGGGRHIILPYIKGVKNTVASPTFELQNNTGTLDKINLQWDIRNNGGKVTVPPSIHKSGNAYDADPKPERETMEIMDTLDPETLCVDNLPDTLETLRGVVMGISPAMADNLTDWKKVIWGIKYTVTACVALNLGITIEDGQDMADDFSRQSNKYVNMDDVLKVWNEGRLCIKYGSLLWWAGQNGYVNKSKPSGKVWIFKGKFLMPNGKYLQTEDNWRGSIDNLEKKIKNRFENTDKLDFDYPVLQKKIKYMTEYLKHADQHKLESGEALQKELNKMFIDIDELYENQTENEKKLIFNHFGQYADLLKLSRSGLTVISVIKYLRGCLVQISNGGNGSFLTINQDTQRDKNGKTLIKTNYISTTLSGICEIYNKRCPVLHWFHTSPECPIENKFYCGGSLADCVRKLLIEPDVIKTYNSQDFVPYLHEDTTDEYTFNMFSGFPIYKLAMTKTGDDFKQSKFYEHTLTHTCNNDVVSFNYLMSWIAHLIQKPDERAGVNILMYGGQGSGKGTLAEFVKSLIGDLYYNMFNSIKDFTNKFNSDQQGKLLILLDELSDTVRGGQEVHNIIKNKTTEDQIRIEIKGREAYLVSNRARYIATSNSENNLRIEADDRRYFCLHVNEADKASTAYYEPLYAEFQDIDNRATAFKYFAEMDISKFDIKKIPNTELKNKQKLQALPLVDFMRDLFNGEIAVQYEDKVKLEPEIRPDEGHYTDIWISGMSLYKLYEQYARDAGEKAKPRKYLYSDIKIFGLPDKPAPISFRDGGAIVSIKGYKINAGDVQNSIRTYLKNPMFQLLE